MACPVQICSGSLEFGCIREVEYVTFGLIFAQKGLAIEPIKGLQPKNGLQQPADYIVHLLPVAADAIQRIKQNQAFPCSWLTHQSRRFVRAVFLPFQRIGPGLIWNWGLVLTCNPTVDNRFPDIQRRITKIQKLGKFIFSRVGGVILLFGVTNKQVNIQLR